LGGAAGTRAEVRTTTNKQRANRFMTVGELDEVISQRLRPDRFSATKTLR
jgi:hypothetical protein